MQAAIKHVAKFIVDTRLVVTEVWMANVAKLKVEYWPKKHTRKKLQYSFKRKVKSYSYSYYPPLLIEISKVHTFSVIQKSIHFKY